MEQNARKISIAADLLVPNGNLGQAQQQPTAAALNYPCAYSGSSQALFFQTIQNAINCVLSLGIFFPWAKIKHLEFVWQNLEVAGSRMRFLGMGPELLKIYFQLTLTLIGVVVLFLASSYVSPALTLACFILLFAAAPFISGHFGFAQFAFLVNHTFWQEMPCHTYCAERDYLKEYVKGFLITALTASFYYPFWQEKLYRLRINSVAVGNLKMFCHEQQKQLWNILFPSYVITVVTLGLYWPWYRAAVMRYRYSNTWLGSQAAGAICGRSSIRGKDLLMFHSLYYFCLFITAGLAFPWLTTYRYKLFSEKISFFGQLKVSN